MKTHSELKKIALSSLSGIWLKVIIALIVSSCLIYICDSFAYLIIPFIIAIPLKISLNEYYFLKVIRNKNELNFKDIFYFFKNNCLKVIILYIIKSIVIGLGFILFIIPGVILELGLSQSYFLLIDDPNLSATDAIAKSWHLMQGKKFDLLVLNLSFIGWFILALISCGLGLLWVVPYMSVTNAAFYENLKNNNEINPNLLNNNLNKEKNITK